MEFFLKYKFLTRTTQFCSLGNLKNTCTAYCQNDFKNGLKKNCSSMAAIWEEYRLLKIEEHKFKLQNKEEFIEELGVSDLIQGSHGDKIFGMSFHLLRNDFDVPDVSYFIEKLLSHLEPFPFNDKQLKYYEAINKKRFNFKIIRNSIEEQYLAWKYQTHPREIAFIYSRYYYSFYDLRSIRNLRRNVALLDTIPKANNKSILEKVFYLNQKPFEISTVDDFDTKIGGFDWMDLVYHYPRALVLTQKHLLFIISFLKELDFTEKQIDEALPYLFIPFRYVLVRLNTMFSNPELLKYRSKDKFLRLLLFKKYELKEFGVSRQVDLPEFLEELKVPPFRRKPATVESLLFLFAQYFLYIYDDEEIIKKHPFFKAIPEYRVRDTLLYLKSKGFTGAEVKESIPIMLYSRKLIEETMNKILEEKNLDSFGFQNGFVPKETPNFSKGTKERNKILQLCLYYMEKPLGFTGDAVWTEDLIKN